MRPRKLPTLFIGIGLIAGLAASANAQVTEQAAREKAKSIVQARLEAGPEHFLDDRKFLDVQRQENLEEELAEIVGGSAGLDYIYKVSEFGVEIKDHEIIYHTFFDVDPTYHVVVSRTDGAAYRVQGFSDSMAEFNRLIAAFKLQVSGDRARGIADLYREIYRQRESITQIYSLLDLKQSAESRCENGSVASGERKFNAWWRHVKPFYKALSFDEKTVQHGEGYTVEWIVLSSADHNACGGAPLRMQVEIEKDGQIANLNFIALPPYAKR
jgi:hypothetical protein